MKSRGKSLGIDYVSTSTIIKESFKFLDRDAIRFFRYLLFLFLPVVAIQLLFSLGAKQFGLLWISPNFYFILSYILMVPFEIAIVREFINRIRGNHEQIKIESRVVLIYLSAVGLLTALGAIDYFVSRALFQYTIVVRIVSGVIGLFSIAMKYITYLLLPVAFLEGANLANSWKSSLKYVVMRWETSLIIMILFGILIRASNFLLTAATLSSQMFNSTSHGERLSVIGSIASLLASFLVAYLVSVSLYGRTRYYLDIKQQEG